MTTQMTASMPASMTASMLGGSPWWVRLLALLVAVVFWISAAAKLRDRPGTARSFAEMGLVAPVALAWFIPVLELVSAFGLIVWPAVGAAVALALLVGFTVVILGVIRSGAVVSCACFGATASAPVGWRSVVRNVALIALATAVLLGG